MPIIKPKLRVRRDGHSISFQRSMGSPVRCGCTGQEAFLSLLFSTHRAFVIRANLLTKVRQTLLAQGKGEDEAGRRAGLGGIIDGQKRRDNFLNGNIAEQHWEGRVNAQALQKP